MKYSTICFMLIIFSSLSYPQTSENEKNATNFEFDKVKLGLNLSNFKDKYPSAEKTKTDDESVGVTTYRVDELKSASYGFFQFFENRLYSVSIVYNENKLNSIGGLETLLNRLKEKLGKDNSNAKKLEEANKIGIVWWNFESIQRFFEILMFKDGDVRLLFDDEAIIKKIKEKKAKSADIGF